MAGTIDTCLAWCRGPRRPHILLTVNASILVMMQDDEKLLQIGRESDWTVPDGVPVVWASHLVGTPLESRVAGVDLMWELLRAADQNELRAYFLGAKQEVLDRLLTIIAETFPGLTVAGSRNGYFGPDEHEHIAQEIRDTNPDILFIGMPTPFKEFWCYDYREQLNTPVLLGVGGSFDVHAGYIKRAPRWMQSIGMEWFWRLIMEPRKMWKRYLVTNSRFIWLTLCAAVRQRLGRGKRP